MLQPIVYTEGENKGEAKKFEDMTPEEQQRYFFQQWWAAEGAAINQLFGIGGKYESTTVNFKLGYQPLGLWENFFTSPVLKNQYFARTAWGKHGTAEVDLFKGSKEITPRFGVDQLSFTLYFSPDRAADYVPRHEWNHVRIIFDRIKRGQSVPTGLIQHVMMGQGNVPRIK